MRKKRPTLMQKLKENPLFAIWFGAFFGAMMAKVLDFFPSVTSMPLYQISPLAGYLVWLIMILFMFGLFSVLIFWLFIIGDALLSRLIN